MPDYSIRQLLYAAGAISLGISLLYSFFFRSRKGPSGVPGPSAAKWTRWWYFWTVYHGNGQDKIRDVHRRYAPDDKYWAPIIRLGPNMFSISHADKSVYGIGSKMAKSAWYEGWKHPDPSRTTLFTERDIPKHNEERKKFQHMYSLSSLLNYEPLVQSTLDVFREKLHDLAKSGQRVDVHHWLQCYAFDVIGCITYGERFGFLDNGEDISGCMASLRTSLVYSTLIGTFPWAHPYIYAILERFPKSGAAARNFIMSMARQMISKRQRERSDGERTDQSNTTRTRDFLDIAMDAVQRGEKGMTDYNVFMVTISNIIAGSDTTAVSLSSIMWYLTTHPNVLAQLRKELDQAREDGRMTVEGVPFKETQDMPYLQACIKEGLRLCPATGLPLWRTVPEGGAEIMGKYFPAGAEVGINTWVAHYDRDVWGPDVNEFRPARWIEAAENPAEYKRLEASYMPFGLGSRTCIGRHISYLEMCKVVPIIVSNFDLELQGGAEKFELENYWFVRPTSFNAAVKLRE